jgi:molybdopterin adenylyltransferase
VKENGVVLAISVSRKRGIPKTNVSFARAREGWGIEGDVHAGTWHRQISLLAMESIEKMRARGLQLRPGAFAENITTRGVNVASLSVGDHLIIGETELEVTQIGKDCHAPCAIYTQAGDCVMPREGIFARVVHGGTMTAGDGVTVVRMTACSPADTTG